VGTYLIVRSVFEDSRYLGEISLAESTVTSVLREGGPS